MRDPAGHGSQRLHLPGGMELLLQHPFASDIPEDPQQKKLPFIGNRGRGNIGEEHGTVFPFHRDVRCGSHPTLGILESGEDFREVFFHMEVQDLQAKNLLLAVPEHFANLSVPHRELHAFCVDQENSVIGVVKDEPEFPLRFRYRSLRQLAPGDIGDHKEKVRFVPVRKSRKQVIQPYCFPEGCDNVNLLSTLPPIRQGIFCGFQHSRVFPGFDLPEVLPENLFDGSAYDFCNSTVGGHTHA
ncbi:MAG TPA: hypothetical protein PK416_12570 [Thermodesulfobacteriota bacterium]|nr:hypothetical protein [Thermodesulfobacteriota bacterium]